MNVIMADGNETSRAVRMAVSADEERNEMAFVFETIRPGDSVEQTPEYQQAIKHNVGGFFGRRVVDYERNASLYCISINDWEERPPGEYLLFYRGMLTRIRAWRKGRTEESKGYIRTFRVVAVNMPQVLYAEREEIIQLMKQAFEALEYEDGKSPPYADAVEIEFLNGWETRK